MGCRLVAIGRTIANESVYRPRSGGRVGDAPVEGLFLIGIAMIRARVPPLDGRSVRAIRRSGMPRPSNSGGISTEVVEKPVATGETGLFVPVAAVEPFFRGSVVREVGAVRCVAQWFPGGWGGQGTGMPAAGTRKLSPS